MENNTIEKVLATQNTVENIDINGVPWMERKFKFPERTIRIGTTFSGIGSPEQALNRLGLKHKIMFACDIDKKVKMSYLLNYDLDESHWYSDVRTLDATPFKGQVDVLVCGSPCQSWSVSGKQKGLEDERGLLFYEFVRMVKETEAPVVIFENVENMVRHNKGESWKKLLTDLINETGYDFHYQVLDAQDYGVAQHRERVIAVGFRTPNPDFKYPAPIPLEKCMKDYLEDDVPSTGLVRRLTPRECLRLMGFPDTFKMIRKKDGSVDKAVYKQAGNSIVVDVMMALFKQIDPTLYAAA